MFNPADAVQVDEHKDENLSEIEPGLKMNPPISGSRSLVWFSNSQFTGNHGDM